MSRDHTDYQTSEQIAAEIAGLKDNLEAEYAACGKLCDEHLRRRWPERA